MPARAPETRPLLVSLIVVVVLLLSGSASAGDVPAIGSIESPENADIMACVPIFDVEPMTPQVYHSREEINAAWDTAAAKDFSGCDFEQLDQLFEAHVLVGVVVEGTCHLDVEGHLTMENGAITIGGRTTETGMCEKVAYAPVFFRVDKDWAAFPINLSFRVVRHKTSPHVDG